MAEVNTNNYQMAIDMLRCHLGLSEDEAKQQLGILQPSPEKRSGQTPTDFYTSQDHH